MFIPINWSFKSFTKKCNIFGSLLLIRLQQEGIYNFVSLIVKVLLLGLAILLLALATDKAQ